MDHVLGRCHFTRQHGAESGHSKSRRADKVRGNLTFMAARRMDARNRYCTKNQQKQKGKRKSNKKRTPKRIELQASRMQADQAKKHKQKSHYIPYICRLGGGKSSARTRLVC